jgi:hypothetical protein
VEKRRFVKSSFDSGDISPRERARQVRREAQALRAETAEILARITRIRVAAYRAALRKKRYRPTG